MTQTIDWDLLCNKWDETPMTLNQDPLALAVAAWQRAVDTNYRVRWPSLESQQPTDADRSLALQLRRYYLGKLSVLALRATRPLTEFQQTLYLMLDTQRYQQGHLGMLYRLPYFYAEDRAHEELRTMLSPIDDSTDHNTGCLRAQRRVLRSRRRGEVMEYWWSDRDNRPVLWPVAVDNPLRSMIEALFNQGSVTIRYNRQIVTAGTGADRWRYFVVNSPELA